MVGLLGDVDRLNLSVPLAAACGSRLTGIRAKCDDSLKEIGRGWA